MCSDTPRKESLQVVDDVQPVISHWNKSDFRENCWRGGAQLGEKESEGDGRAGQVKDGKTAADTVYVISTPAARGAAPTQMQRGLRALGCECRRARCRSWREKKGRCERGGGERGKVSR